MCMRLYTSQNSFFACSILSQSSVREATRRKSMAISIVTVTKPSIRKHSCFEALLSDHQIKQDKNSLFALFLSPSSPCRKTRSRIYSCIFTSFCIVFTIAAFLHCSSLDAPQTLQQNYASPVPDDQKPVDLKPTPAFKGLGTVFRRGTFAMNDLVVAHVGQKATLQEFRIFLRSLHRSGLPARADVVFIFEGSRILPSMVNAIHEENNYFLQLLNLLDSGNADGNVDSFSSNSSAAGSRAMFRSVSSTLLSSLFSAQQVSNASLSPFNINAYRKASSSSGASGQPLWGIHTTDTIKGDRAAKTLSPVWGSIVGFDVSELNPDDTLQGFIDSPPLILRRWACYQMLLGMIKHRFKQVLLTDVRGVLVLGDPFSIVKRKLGLYLSLEDRAWAASNGKQLRMDWGSLDSDDKTDVENVIHSVPSTSSDMSRNGRHLRVHRRGRNVNAPLISAFNDAERTLLSADKGGTRRQPNLQSDAHQRGYRRRKRKSSIPTSGGLYEKVYGRKMWSSLEEAEKRKKLVNSGVLVGSIQQVRGLANTMVTEIVKVALERKNREAFPDSVLLSYLLHKSSSVLGKRVLDHLHLVDNSESFVHSLIGSQQVSLFHKRSKVPYPIIHGGNKSRRWTNVVRAVFEDICFSPVDSEVYGNCQRDILEATD